MESILALMFASFGLGQALADLGDSKEVGYTQCIQSLYKQY